MLKMNKKVVFLGTATGKTREQFHEYYLKEHCPRITADENVLQYYANNIVVPSQALIDAGWGWGGYDESGIFAMDELWVKDGFDFMSMYEGEPGDQDPRRL